MSEHEAHRADRGSALAIPEALAPALDEIRWRHPQLRASCGTFVGPAIRILATSHPADMPSLVGVRAVGAPASAFANLLIEADEVTTRDVREHPQLRTISPAILGAETRAVAIVPLRAEGEVVGFLHLDARHVETIDRDAVECLHNLAAMASVVILLEQERTRSEAHVARVHQLRTTMCRQTVLEREAGLELKQATRVLHQMIESAAPKLGQAERAELSSLVRACTDHVNAAARTLSSAGCHPPDDERPAAAETN